MTSAMLATLIFNFIVLDDSQTLGNAFDFGDDFFLHQIEAHRQQCDTKQQVQRAECNRLLKIRLFALRRNEISKSWQSGESRRREE